MSEEYSSPGKGRTVVQPPEYEDEGATPIIGTKSPGVARIEALSNQITTGNRIAIFIGVFLIAYAYGLVSFCHSYRRFSTHSLSRMVHYDTHTSRQRPQTSATIRCFLQSTL